VAASRTAYLYMLSQSPSVFLLMYISYKVYHSAFTFEVVVN